jgi:N-acyl-D-aspartate/D-glutamate deacylase
VAVEVTPAGGRPPILDVVLEGGDLVDGTGAPPRRADVGLAGDRVAAVGDLGSASRRRTIPCAGRVVAPGFIDIHSHSDVSCLLHPQGRSSLLQGITTEVVGNCGYSLGPRGPDSRAVLFDRLLGRCLGPNTADSIDWSWRTLPEFMEMVGRRGTGTNKTFLVGGGSLRAAVLGTRLDPASSEEIARMRAHLEEALEAGAIGLSTGLEYSPGAHAGTGEIVALARVLPRYGALYASHMRNESDRVATAVDELLDIGRQSGARVHVSHHNVVGRRNRGRLVETVAHIHGAHAGGVDVTLDFLHFHPYYHPHRLDEILPPELSELPFAALREQLERPGTRDRVRAAIATGWINNLEITYPSADWDYNILEAPGLRLPEHASVAELAEEAGVPPLELALDLIRQASGPILVSRVIAPEDVRTVLGSPLVMAATDTYAVDRPLDPSMALHPRTYAAYPRFLARHIREQRLMPLHEAIWRMTGYPAERFRLPDRGHVAEGRAADVVVFDPDAIADLATLTDPYRGCTGIAHVFVNGVEVVTGGVATDARPGRILRRA